MLFQLIQKKTFNICLKVAKTAKGVTFRTKRKVKQKDSEYKTSSLVHQSDCKNTKEKSKILVKCFVNSFTKVPPISARNVPKLPEMSLFEPRKKSKKRIAISKTLKLIWQVIQKNTFKNSLEMCLNCLKSHCLNQRKKSTKRIAV